jgi:hypothetical protein
MEVWGKPGQKHKTLSEKKNKTEIEMTWVMARVADSLPSKYNHWATERLLPKHMQSIKHWTDHLKFSLSIVKISLAVKDSKNTFKVTYVQCIENLYTIHISILGTVFTLSDLFSSMLPFMSLGHSYTMVCHSRGPHSHQKSASRRGWVLKEHIHFSKAFILTERGNVITVC